MIGIDHMPRWSGVDDVTMVAAHPNDGAMALGQIDSSDIVAVPNTSQPLKQTQKLTVWRTLNVECDRMVYFNNPSNPDDGTIPFNPADYLGGVVSAEFAKACVAIYDRTPTNNANPGDYQLYNDNCVVRL